MVDWRNKKNCSKKWTIRRKYKTKISELEMKHLRRIAGKTKWDRMKNEGIRKIVKQEPIIEKNKQMNWYGHILRMKADRLTRKIMETSNTIKKRRVRPPKKKWIVQIQELGTKREKT